MKFSRSGGATVVGPQDWFTGTVYIDGIRNLRHTHATLLLKAGAPIKRQRTTRALDTWFYDGDLPTHRPRHAAGGAQTFGDILQACADLPASTR